MIDVLLIESSDIHAETLIALFRESGDIFSVQWVLTLEEALEVLLTQPSFDAITTNIILADAGGAEVMQKLNTDIPVICIVDGVDDVLARAVLAAGAQDYLRRDELSPALLRKSIFYAIERARLRSQISNLTITDDLTGVYNRRGFNTLAIQQLKIAKRFGRPVTLLYVDLDNLKQINDQLSHRVGDIALIEVADTLRDALRSTDVVARVGGDEFIVLAPDTNHETVQRAIERFRGLLKTRNKTTTEFKLSASIGSATYSGKGEWDLDILIAEAEALMYDEKNSKKGNGGVTT